MRVGVALSDPDGLLASPLVTLACDDDLATAISAMVNEHEAIEVVIGLPRHLNGSEGASASAARELARSLLGKGIEVRLIDERLTTRSAASALRSSGRNARQQREIIDQEAARQILQLALDSERASGAPPGVRP